MEAGRNRGPDLPAVGPSLVVAVRRADSPLEILKAGVGCFSRGKVDTTEVDSESLTGAQREAANREQPKLMIDTINRWNSAFHAAELSAAAASHLCSLRQDSLYLMHFFYLFFFFLFFLFFFCFYNIPAKCIPACYVNHLPTLCGTNDFFNGIQTEM